MCKKKNQKGCIVKQHAVFSPTGQLSTFFLNCILSCRVHEMKNIVHLYNDPYYIYMGMRAKRASHLVGKHFRSYSGVRRHESHLICVQIYDDGCIFFSICGRGVYSIRVQIYDDLCCGLDSMSISFHRLKQLIDTYIE